MGAWERRGMGERRNEEKPSDTGTPFDAFHLLRAGGGCGDTGGKTLYRSVGVTVYRGKTWNPNRRSALFRT